MGRLQNGASPLCVRVYNGLQEGRGYVAILILTCSGDQEGVVYVAMFTPPHSVMFF